MEKSLQSCIEVQQQVYGSVGLESFEKLMAFLRLCYKDYQKQLDDDTHDIVPRCLWKDQTQTLYYSMMDRAFQAGLVDGAWEMLVGVVDLLNFVDCWLPVSPSLRFWFDEDCSALREKSKNVFSSLGSVVTDGEKFTTFTSQVGEQLSSYMSSLGDFFPHARHEQGKLVFNVASLFIGAGAPNAVVKGASITQKIGVAVEKTAGLMAKIKLPAAVKLIPKPLSQMGKATVFAMTLTVGTLSTELVTVVPKASGVLEYVIGVGDNVVNALPKVTAAIAENEAKIQQAVESVAKAENAVLKAIDKGGNIVELGSGKLVSTDIGSHLVLSTVIEDPVQNIRAIDKLTATVSVLAVVGAGAGAGNPKDKDDCELCTPRTKNDPALCTLLKAVKNKATDKIKANAALEKLCRVPITELTTLELRGITSKLNNPANFTGTHISTFSEDVISCVDRNKSLCNNLPHLKARHTDGWLILESAMESANSYLRKDFDCIQYATGIYEYKPDSKPTLINSIKARESKKNFLVQLCGIAQATSNDDEAIARLDATSKEEAFNICLTQTNVFEYR
jgi:hypothetical protein